MRVGFSGAVGVLLGFLCVAAAGHDLFIVVRCCFCHGWFCVRSSAPAADGGP